VLPWPEKRRIADRRVSRGPQWHTAWEDVKSHPWSGSGAGSFDVWWFQHREVAISVHDVHNLYLETLAELGPVGLLLLLGALVVPLIAAVRALGRPLAAVAFGAYVAFLLHAAVDWDWEMPAVILAGLFCGLALLADTMSDRPARRLSRGVRAAGLAIVVGLGAFVVVTLLGNRAVSASSSAADAASYRKAEQAARRAMDFLPWSSEPWPRVGEAQAGAGDLIAARSSFRKALAKEPGD
jgi:O-antigen ligase